MYANDLYDECARACSFGTHCVPTDVNQFGFLLFGAGITSRLRAAATGTLLGLFVSQNDLQLQEGKIECAVLQFECIRKSLRKFNKVPVYIQEGK